MTLAPPVEARTDAADTDTGVRGAGVARRLKKIVGDWLVLLPFLLIGGGLLIAAAVRLIILSFYNPDTGVAGWQAWQAIFAEGRTHRGAIFTSLRVSVATCTICTLLGTPLAWYVHNLRRRGKAFAVALTNTFANFVGVSLVRAFVTAFGAAGLFTVLMRNLFGVEMGNWLFTEPGVIAIYCYFTLPLYVLLVSPAMGALQPQWWEAVQTSAGTRRQFWRHVGLPVLAPFVLSGWVLTFAWSMGQYAVPDALLGTGSGVHLMTLQIGNYVTGGSVFEDQSQQAAAYAVLLMAIAAAALAVALLISRKPLRRLEGS